jgi:hypothetical protein
MPLSNRIHVLPRYLKKSTTAFANSEYPAAGKGASSPRLEPAPHPDRRKRRSLSPGSLTPVTLVLNSGAGNIFEASIIGRAVDLVHQLQWLRAKKLRRLSASNSA